jgi:hypothetical protein
MGVADMVKKIKIYQGSPNEASIMLDGVNVADSVRGVNVVMRPDCLPAVELDLAIIDVSMDLQHPQILIPASTRHLLIELGWTPPAPPYRVNLIKGGPMPWD